MTQTSNHQFPAGILMVSYTSFLQQFYQSLPNQIAKQSNAIVDVLVPPYWKEMWSGGKVYLQQLPAAEFRLHVGRIFYPGNLHFAFYLNRLAGLLKQNKPGIIDLEDEPFNLGSLQMVWYRNLFSPDSKLVFHASQHNLKKYPPPFNMIEQYVLRHADAVLVRNSRAEEVLRKKGYRGLLEIVTHGVDTQAFSPDCGWELQEKMSPQNKPIVGFVGALEPHKGVETLLQALASLDCKSIIVGAGSLEKPLKNQAQELGLDITFMPPQDHQMIAKLMACMDIFVLPSLSLPNLEERFGRVLIEAMSSGTAVVASDCGEIPVVVGDAGLIFPEGDHRTLHHYLKNLLENPQKLKSLQQTGRMRVENNYSWQAIAAKTLDIYHSILNR